MIYEVSAKNKKYHISLSQDFINETNIKKCIKNNVDVDEFLTKSIDSSIIQINSVCFQRNISFYKMKAVLELHRIFTENIPQKSDLLYYTFGKRSTYIPTELLYTVCIQRYYIILLMINILNIDKRILYENKEWMDVSTILYNSIETSETDKDIHLYNIPLINEVKRLTSKYILFTKSPCKFLIKSFNTYKKDSNLYNDTFVYLRLS